MFINLNARIAEDQEAAMSNIEKRYDRLKNATVTIMMTVDEKLYGRKKNALPLAIQPAKALDQASASSTRENALVQPVQTKPAASQSNGPGMVVLASLILVAAVANLNLSVANVALPSIGAAFDASQVELNLVAVGYSLGLAASVLWFGALGDRYGRKMMLIIGTTLAIPTSLLAAYSPTVDVLFIARFFGGLAAGMTFPTTLALITALWSGAERTKSIALWSGLGGAIALLGPMTAGFFLEHTSGVRSS